MPLLVLGMEARHETISQKKAAVKFESVMNTNGGLTTKADRHWWAASKRIQRRAGRTTSPFKPCNWPVCRDLLRGRGVGALPMGVMDGCSNLTAFTLSRP